ncbi:MAG: efflux RND transporter periplasmic adaptor subunit [Alphaproteobacteria bacterium]
MWLRQILGVLVVAALAAGGWLLLSPSDTNDGGSAGTASGPGRGGGAPVVTDAVTMAESGQSLRAIGTAEAVRSVTLYPAVSGEVRIVLFAAGEAVEPGDPLLALDDEEEQLAVGLARIQMEEQQRVVARNEQLAPSGAVPASVAQSAQAQLAEARNRLAAAELALERRTLLAPFGGVMGLTGIAEGDRVTPTTPIATIDDRSSLLISFEVPERYAAQVAIGQTVAATTSALPGAVFEGRISALDSRLDPGTRTLVVQATIPNVDDRLRAGLSFAVDLAFASTSLPSVPEMAVQWSRDGAFVWRIVDGTAERVPVSLVERTAGRVMVNAALAAGDRVVVEGTQRMREGRAVVEAMADTAADAEPGV